MAFLVEVIVGGCIIFALVSVLRGTVRRYQRCTFRDSNAPRGRRTDWGLFFGRK